MSRKDKIIFIMNELNNFSKDSNKVKSAKEMTALMVAYAEKIIDKLES